MEYTDILTSRFICSVYKGPLHFDMIMWLLCVNFLLLAVTFYTWWRHQKVLFIISHTQSQSVLENNSTWREKLLSFHFQKPKTQESSSKDRLTNKNWCLWSERHLVSLENDAIQSRVTAQKYRQNIWLIIFSCPIPKTKNCLVTINETSFLIDNQKNKRKKTRIMWLQWGGDVNNEKVNSVQFMMDKARFHCFQSLC